MPELAKPLTAPQLARTLRDVALVAACAALLAAAARPAPLRLTEILASPSTAHPLGTDNLGRDLLARIGAALVGGVLPLWATVLASVAGGLLLGALLAAAPARGVACNLARLARMLAVAVTLPPLFLVVFAAAALNGAAGLAPLLVPLALAVVARTVLDVDDLARRDGLLAFWEAHAALGGARFARIWRYGIATAWAERLAATLLLGLQTAVVAEASLAFLGYGRQEPQASLGNMLAAHFDLLLKGKSLLPLALACALALTAAAPAAGLRLASAAYHWSHGRASRFQRKIEGRRAVTPSFGAS